MGTRLIAEELSLLARVGGGDNSGGVKKILDGVTLVANPGEFLAIMGPSGSGKTSLLNVIAGRTRNKLRTRIGEGGDDDIGLKKHPIPIGTIYINGNAIGSSQLKQISRYVMQSDCLLPYLSVEETITFAASLKLTKLSRAQRKAAVDKVIADLGLDSCRKVPIGNNIKKGISGGQKKRVSIAIELLEDPQVIFLDEPTSGLDSSLAFDVCKVVKQLARTGKTIIATIHQPRTQIFTMFDRLALLSLGRMVYQGPAPEIKQFWTQVGHPIPPRTNVADYSLDMLTVAQLENDPQASRRHWGSRTSRNSREGSFARSTSAERLVGRQIVSEIEIKSFPEKYAASTWCAAVKQQVKEGKASPGILPKELKTANAGANPVFKFFRNICTIAHRQFLNRARNLFSFAVQCGVSALLALIIGLLFFKVKMPTNAMDCLNYFNVLGVVAFSGINQSFTTLTVWFEFPESRPMYNRERAGGLYNSVSAYIGLVIGDLPYLFVPPLLHWALVYWLAALGAAHAEWYLIYLAMVMSVAWAASGWSMFSSMLAPSAPISTALAPIGVIISVLLSGMWISESALPVFWKGVKYISWIRYAANAYLIKRFEGSQIIEHCAPLPSSPNAWGNIGMVIAVGLGWRVLACICFAFTNTRAGLEA